MASSSTKRARKTIEQKVEILKAVENGGSSHEAIAKTFGISRTAVTKMVKERASIMSQFQSKSMKKRKVLKYKHNSSLIEDMLLRWHMQVEIDAPSLNVTGEVLQAKALFFRDKLLHDFP
jgi:transposase-like protein